MYELQNYVLRSIVPILHCIELSLPGRKKNKIKFPSRYVVIRQWKLKTAVDETFYLYRIVHIVITTVDTPLNSIFGLAPSRSLQLYPQSGLKNTLNRLKIIRFVIRINGFNMNTQQNCDQNIHFRSRDFCGKFVLLFYAFIFTAV